MSLRIGYSFWGFLGDRKVGPRGEELSTPDGNATYSWSIVWEAMQRGHTVVPLQEERDVHGIERYGDSLFGAFSKQKRSKVYEHLAIGGWNNGSHVEFPELDVVLIEWRFPIPGRNTPDAKGTEWYQRDLERQTQLFEHYAGTKTKVIVWDLDHKYHEMLSCHPGAVDAVFETSVSPVKRSCGPRTRVEPPFVIEDLLQHGTVERTGAYISYIGSRYERDDVIDRWMAPMGRVMPGRVAFHGKWEPREELVRRWPGIVFHDRIGVGGFHESYRASGCVPLLAKQSYMESGFVTPRVWEAILFGTVPVGLGGHLGIESYCDLVAKDPGEMMNIVFELADATVAERNDRRLKAVEKIRFMDASNFVDRLEEVVDGHHAEDGDGAHDETHTKEGEH